MSRTRKTPGKSVSPTNSEDNSHTPEPQSDNSGDSSPAKSQEEANYLINKKLKALVDDQRLVITGDSLLD